MSCCKGKFRALSTAEITQLKSQGCWAESWSDVTVCDGAFNPANVIGTLFRGKVTLGAMDSQSHIVRSTLQDVVLGDRFQVSDVSLLSGYVIGDDFKALACSVIKADRRASFGIGTAVCVVNEGGGRDVLLSAHLTSNIAYMVAMHGYRGDIASAYSALVEKERHEVAPKIGHHVTIEGSARVEDVRIGDCAKIVSVSSLRNGTILSQEVCPTVIENAVVMQNFVVAEGAKVFGGANLTNVYIGECSEVGNGFTAENMLAFANCQLLCGEAVAVLAGPFTVSHHKTTLLIAGAYSFFNAGSATNASNHHYRLGPLHQAVYDRGVKTGSGSYLLEPAHIGAYTMVVGHHKTNPDTSGFPFSILAEKDGESHLLIAQNLKTIGIFRDSRKWVKRDKRAQSIRRDKFTPEVLSPFTVQTMMRAIESIKAKLASSSSELLILAGLRLKRVLLERAISAYQQAIDVYVFGKYSSANSTADVAMSDSSVEDMTWCDFGGLVVPIEEVRKIEDKLIQGAYSSVEDLSMAIDALAEKSEALATSWAIAQAHKFFASQGVEEGDSQVLANALKARDDFFATIAADAQKEWGKKLAVGYGLDGTPDEAWSDYLRIKGTPETNSAIAECNKLAASPENLI